MMMRNNCYEHAGHGGASLMRRKRGGVEQELEEKQEEQGDEKDRT